VCMCVCVCVCVWCRRCAEIVPLLEVDDMVRMTVPDWKCVFTYVQSFYRRFAMLPRPLPRYRDDELV